MMIQSAGVWTVLKAIVLLMMSTSFGGEKISFWSMLGKLVVVVVVAVVVVVIVVIVVVVVVVLVALVVVLAVVVVVDV